MTLIVLFGDIPSTGVIREAKAVRTDVPATPEASLAFLDQMAQGLRDRAAVLVLYPAWRPEPAARLVRMARLLLNTDRIAGLPLDLPPLALSLVADQLAFVAPYVKAGQLAGLGHYLAKQVYAGAWVNSVAKLEHIETGFGQHVSSYLPGGGFAVSAAPVHAVHRITSAKPMQEIPHRPTDPVLILATHENGDVGWLQGKFQPALRAASLTFVGTQPLSQKFWGTKKYAEFVVFSGHLHALQNALRALPVSNCRWCGEPTSLAICPFCAMVQPDRRPAAPRPQQPAGPQPYPGASRPATAQPQPAGPPPGGPPPNTAAHPAQRPPAGAPQPQAQPPPGSPPGQRGPRLQTQPQPAAAQPLSAPPPQPRTPTGAVQVPPAQPSRRGTGPAPLPSDRKIPADPAPVDEPADERRRHGNTVEFRPVRPR